MMKKLLTFIITLAIAGSAVSADFTKAGSAGAQFLKIGVGSKYQGMGEASVAIANDVYSMYWNPAGLVEVEHAAIGFTNVNYLLDISLNYVGFAQNFENIGVFGVSATVLSTGKQEITTFDQQDGTGEYYTATSYALGLSFARQLTDKFAFGASIKYLGEKIHNETATGFGVDFGTMLYTGFKSLRMGMSITNMGPEMKFSGSDLIVHYDQQNGGGSNSAVNAELQTTPYDLPMAFKVGLAYDFYMNPNAILTLSSELKHPNDNQQQGSMGAQLGFNDRFFLRGGYKINYDEEGLALGGGISTNMSRDTRLIIDYAWQDFGRLESTQRFSVGFTF